MTPVRLALARVERGALGDALTWRTAGALAAVRRDPVAALRRPSGRDAPLGEALDRLAASTSAHQASDPQASAHRASGLGPTRPSAARDRPARLVAPADVPSALMRRSPRPAVPAPGEPARGRRSAAGAVVAGDVRLAPAAVPTSPARVAADTAPAPAAPAARAAATGGGHTTRRAGTAPPPTIDRAPDPDPRLGGARRAVVAPVPVLAPGVLGVLRARGVAAGTARQASGPAGALGPSARRALPAAQGVDRHGAAAGAPTRAATPSAGADPTDPPAAPPVGLGPPVSPGGHAPATPPRSLAELATVYSTPAPPAGEAAALTSAAAVDGARLSPVPPRGGAAGLLAMPSPAADVAAAAAAVEAVLVREARRWGLVVEES